MIKTKCLSKTYNDQGKSVEVLKSLNLEIQSGEFVAIVGKSGSGKSTLISILSGLDLPSSGELVVDGHRLDQMREDELVEFRRSTLGFVFQNHNLIPTLTAKENITMPADLRGDSSAKKKAEELLDKVGLKDRASHYPSQLSGGEQQRVAICRALINDPKLIFADEPTGNLDTQTGSSVMDLLLGLRGSRTLVIVTHDHELARLAYRIIELQDGKIVESETASTGT